MTDLVVQGVGREFIVAENARMNVGGLVREFIVAAGSPVNRLIVSGLVREFIVATPTTSPNRRSLLILG